jgi:hypothetical protein
MNAYKAIWGFLSFCHRALSNHVILLCTIGAIEGFFLERYKLVKGPVIFAVIQLALLIILDFAVIVIIYCIGNANSMRGTSENP